jgi:hypothetical protein
LNPVLKKAGAGAITSSIARESLAGAGLGAAYGGLEGQAPTDILKSAGIGALLGGAGAGLFTGVPAAYRAIQRRSTPTITPEITPGPATAAIPEAVPTPQAGMAQRTPTPLLTGTPRLALPEPAIQLPPPSIKPTTLPGTFRLPGEKVQIKPTTLAGTLKLVNKEYNKAAQEYEDAMQEIQNYFGTWDLRASELARVKDELGIDLDAIATKLENAEAKALMPKPEEARLKRAAGVSTESQYKLLEDITSPARTFDVTDPQQVRGFINQDKLAQKLRIEREAAKIPEKPFPKVPEQFRRETPFTAFKGELQPQKPTAAETARIAEAAPTLTKPVKVAKAAKLTKQVAPETKQPTKPVVVEPKQPLKASDFQQMQAKVPAKQFVEATTPISPTGTFKISQTRLNTFARTTEFKQKSKEFLPEREFGVEKGSADKWKEAGMLKYMSNKNAVIDDLLSDKPLQEGADTFAAKYALKEAEKKAIKTGKYENLLTLTKKYSQKVSKNATALKAHDLAWEKAPTPVNTLRKAQQVIDTSSDQLLKQNPKIKGKIEKELADVSRNIQLAVKEATGETIKALRLDLQLFAKKQRDSIERLIGKHFSTDPLKRGEIINKLISQFGLDGAEAKKLADRINFIFEQKFNRASENYLRRLLKLENKQNPTLEKIMKLIRSGAYDDVNITNVLKEKYGLPILTPDEAKKIVKMVDELNKLKAGSEEHSIKLAQIRAMIEDKEPKNWVDKQRALKNISLLYNPTTFLTSGAGVLSMNTLDVITQNTAGVILDKLASLRTGKYSSGYSSGKKLVSGAIKGVRDASIDMAGGIRLRDLEGMTPWQKTAVIVKGSMNPIQRPIFDRTTNPLDLKSGLTFKGKNKYLVSDSKAKKIIGKILEGTGKVGRFLEAQTYYTVNLFDRAGKQSAYDDTLASLVRLNKGKELDAIKKQALELATEKTAKENIKNEKLYAKKLKENYIESLDSLIATNTSNEIDDIKRLAQRIGEERALVDLNTLSSLGKMLLDMPAKLKDKPAMANTLSFVINSIQPFMTISLNSLKRGIEFSPIGFTEGLFQFSKLLAKGNKATLSEQRYAVDRLARGFVGSLVWLAGYEAWKQGFATGDVPKSKDMREFFKALEIKPNAIKIGDKTYDFSNIVPQMMSFNSGKEFNRLVEESKKKGLKTGLYDASDAMMQSALKSMQFYTENPFLETIGEIYGGRESVMEGIARFAQSVPSQYMPANIRKSAYVSDDFDRFVGDKTQLKEILINPLKRSTPVIRENLPKLIGTLGQEIKTFGGKNSFWNVYFNPIKVGGVEPTKVQSEILRLYESTNDTSVFPNMFTKTIKLDSGKQKVLSAQEMMDYQRIMGESVNNSIEKLLNNPRYINLPDTSETTNNTKLQAIKKTIENSVQIAREEMAKQLGVDTPKEKKRKTPLRIRVPNE